MSRVLSGAPERTRRLYIAGALGVAALLLCGFVSADGNRPVRSVLEIRHERVMIQKWDLSCGAAALGTLLRYQFGEPVTEKQVPAHVA